MHYSVPDVEFNLRTGNGFSRIMPHHLLTFSCYIIVPVQ
jgi:hypothetical protein